MTNRFILILLISALSLIGCSSSDSDSSDSDSSAPGAASINGANAKDLATAATEGAKFAADSSNASQFSLKSAARPGAESMSEILAREFSLMPLDVSAICTGGGGATADALPDGSVLLDLQQCNIGGVIADGVVTINSTVSGSITTTSLVYTNFSITVGSETSVSNLSAVCVFDSSISSASCTYSSTVVGFDGRTYSISGLSVTGDSIAGYSVSASITDPVHGIIAITTTNPILFNCPNGQPIQGEIQFTDSAGVLVTVTFNDCDSFTVFYNGVATLYNW